jgi:cell division protein FtsN
MRPEIPQTAAPDENEDDLLVLPALMPTKESVCEDEHVLAVEARPANPSNPSAPAALPGSSEGAQSAAMPVASLEALATGHTERGGRRVMRASPAVLISCGLVFISLIFLLNLMMQTGTTSAHRGAESPSAPGSQETKQTTTANAPEQVTRTNAPAPEPKPSIPVATVAPASEVASVAPPADAGATQSQAPQPAPASTPATTEIKPHDTPRPNPATPESEDGFTLQIGSYNAMAQAQERVSELGAAGVTAYVARVEIPKRGTWYRVQVGHFGSREEASRQGTQLRSKGAVADFIVTPSKAS